MVRNWQDVEPTDEHAKRLGIVPYRGASKLVEEPLGHFESFVIEADHADALGQIWLSFGFPLRADF